MVDCGGGVVELWAMGMRRSFRTRGVGWWGTQSGALGWYTVSLWDTGGCVLREVRVGVLRTQREL